jgi:hypothetical protein
VRRRADSAGLSLEQLSECAELLVDTLRKLNAFLRVELDDPLKRRGKRHGRARTVKRVSA